MHKKRKKPEIRFAGHETEWIEKKFDDTFDMLSNNTLSRDALNYDGGVAKNVHYGDVLVKFGEYLDADREQLPYINDATVALKFLKSYLKDGDIVIADTAEDESVGKCTEVIGVGGTPIISGLHTIPCRPKQKYAPKYMGYYLNSNAYHDRLLPLMQGVKVTSISKTGIKDTDVILSDEFEEQAKIGEFLSSLDDRIASEVSKYEKLIIVKKSLMEKLFPKNGSNAPEIRFNGFTDAWEQHKLEEYLSERDERTSEGELLSVTINYGIKRFSELGRHDNSSEDKSKYKKVCIGDIAYNSMRMWQGASGYSRYDGIVSPAYTVLSPNEGVDSKFFGYLFKCDDMIRTFQICSQGITSDNWNLKYPSLKEIVVAKPTSLVEQEKISSLLEEIDNLIALHQCRLDKLRNIKSSCMEKMYV